MSAQFCPPEGSRGGLGGGAPPGTPPEILKFLMPGGIKLAGVLIKLQPPGLKTLIIKFFFF